MADLANIAAHPAIAALVAYAAAAPAIRCDEGYWDDMESAGGDGMRQEKSEAAILIRAALKALGIEPPKGLETCPDCFAYADAPGRGIDHSCQCQLVDDEEGDDADA